MCGPALVGEVERRRIAAWSAVPRAVSRSPFGPDDEIGMLNLMDGASRAAVLARAGSGTVFDLAVDFFMGMPTWTGLGDPSFQQWLTHRPSGTVIDDPAGMGREANEEISYSGDAISMYVHCGTHVDTLCHWGYHGTIWNGFTEREHLGDRSWKRCGADRQPPIVARGVLVDVAAAQGADVLPASFGIGPAEIEEALRRQGSDVRPGDVVLVRTGRMRLWPDPDGFMLDEPGLTLAGAEWLAKAGAIVIGADNLALEQIPSQVEGHWSPVHTYLLAECGVAILELANLEELSAEGVHEFLFVGACLKIRGATGAPIRPLAIPLA